MKYYIKILYKRLKTVALYMTGTITHVETKGPVAALTFDDGPHPEFTPRLLDILSRVDVTGGGPSICSLN